jgi:hypothetical protein
MAVKAVRSREDGEIVGGVAHLLAEEVDERAFGLVGASYSHVICGHQRVVGTEKEILA